MIMVSDIVTALPTAVRVNKAVLLFQNKELYYDSSI